MLYKFYMHFLVIVQRFEHFYVIALYKLKYYYYIIIRPHDSVEISATFTCLSMLWKALWSNDYVYGYLHYRDQRITQDVDKTCRKFSEILAQLLISPFTITYYVYQTWSR